LKDQFRDLRRMDSTAALIWLIAIAVAVVAGGILYRRFRSRSLPPLSDEEFLRTFYKRHTATIPSAVILAERRRIAKVLGLAPEKLAPDQSVTVLSERLSYLAEFSVAWNDLADEAAEARCRNGVPSRQRPPTTIGQLIEDRTMGFTSEHEGADL
jgi:hypothetical protein